MTDETSPPLSAQPHAASPSEPASSVFISYSRVEEPIVRVLDKALSQAGMEVWVDWDDIRPSEDWVKRILSEIERIGTMLVVITPESCGSRVCNLELNHAAKLGKRLIPILRRDVPRESLNEHLKNLHWIFFREGDDPDKAMADLQFALRSDLDWIDEQARLLTKALEWDRGRRRWAATLRGPALRAAELWLARADNVTRIPLPLHREFLRASRRATNQFRMAAFAGTVVLMILAVLAPILWERSQSRERETVDTQLRLDQNSSPSSLDLSRRSSLTQLLQRANSSGHASATTTIQRKLAQIPPADSRRELLSSDASRRGLVSSSTGNRLFLWSADRIEAYGPEGGNPPAVYRQKNGRILWVEADPCVDGILFEVDFDSYADHTTAASVYSRQDRRFRKHEAEHDIDGWKLFESEVIGNERGIFFVSMSSPDGGAPELIGLTRQFDEIPLTSNRDGDRTGYVFLARPKQGMITREGLVEQRYARLEQATQLFRQHGYGLTQDILSVLPDNLKATPRAYATNDQAVLYEVAYPGVNRTGFLDPQLGPLTYEFILPQLREGNDRVIELARPTIFCQHAKLFRDPDNRLNLTDVRPNFQPAALDMVRRQAVLGDLLVRFPEGQDEPTSTRLAFDESGVIGVQFTLDGGALILIYQDRGAGLFDLQTRLLKHRFPGPSPQVRDVAVSRDGRFVYLLEENGTLSRWNLSAFGSDGWSARSITSNSLDTSSEKTVAVARTSQEMATVTITPADNP